jgi:hypothetical protein
MTQFAVVSETSGRELVEIVSQHVDLRDEGPITGTLDTSCRHLIVSVQHPWLKPRDTGYDNYDPQSLLHVEVYHSSSGGPANPDSESKSILRQIWDQLERPVAYSLQPEGGKREFDEL